MNISSEIKYKCRNICDSGFISQHLPTTKASKRKTIKKEHQSNIKITNIQAKQTHFLIVDKVHSFKTAIVLL
jgi:hypothetical protein